MIEFEIFFSDSPSNNPTISPTNNPVSTLFPTLNPISTLSPTTYNPTTSTIESTEDVVIITVSSNNIDSLDPDEVTDVVLIAIEDTDVTLVSTTVNTGSIEMELSAPTLIDNLIATDIEDALESEFNEEFVVSIESNDGQPQVADKEDKNGTIISILIVIITLLLCSTMCIGAYIITKNKTQKDKEKDTGGDHSDMVMEEGVEINSTIATPGYQTGGGDAIDTADRGELDNDVELMHLNEEEDELYEASDAQSDEDNTQHDTYTKGKTSGNADNDQEDKMYDEERRVVTAIGKDESEEDQDEIYDGSKRVKTPIDIGDE